MALNKTVLKNLITAELAAQGLDTTGEHSQINKLATALSNAIIAHITSSAIVSTNVSTITSCGAGPGSGTGTGTGSIS